jgi:transposase
VRVLYDRVAAIDVHKDMIKVAVRVPGSKRGARKTDVLEYRTFYGVLQAMARELRGRGVTHVVMEAPGVYTEPVYYALTELDFEEVMVVNPAHVKALKGHKTDAKDAVRLLDLYECGAVMRGSYIPAPDLKEVRDLARYRVKTVQARTSEIQRLQKTLESAGIKIDSVLVGHLVPGQLHQRPQKNKGAKKRAIIAIAHTLLKIAFAILKTGRPYREPGADFYTRRDSDQARQDYLLRQLQKLNPGCTITLHSKRR